MSDESITKYNSRFFGVNEKWDNRFLELARHVSNWSKDPSTKCGAVCIGGSGQVLSTGYNGFPRGCNDSEDLYLDREYKYKNIVHAEMNAIFNASLNGVSLDGSTMFVSGMPPCNNCSSGIVQSGISRVVYHCDKAVLPESWQTSCDLGFTILRSANVIYRYHHL